MSGHRTSTRVTVRRIWGVVLLAIAAAAVSFVAILIIPASNEAYAAPWQSSSMWPDGSIRYPEE